MNILTFDIEDWYNHDDYSEDFEWDKFEVRLYEGVDKYFKLYLTVKLKVLSCVLDGLRKSILLLLSKSLPKIII